MYQIVTTGGEILGYTDTLNYIRKNDNGIYIRCNQPQAQGIAYKSVAYNLTGHNEIDGETVIISEIDYGNFIHQVEQIAANLDYLAMMAKVDLPTNEETPQDDESINQEAAANE